MLYIICVNGQAQFYTGEFLTACPYNPTLFTSEAEAHKAAENTLQLAQHSHWQEWPIQKYGYQIRQVITLLV